MYAQDYNNRFPGHGCGWGRRLPLEICYAAKVYEYLNNLQVFICTTDPTCYARPGRDGNGYGNNLGYIAGRSPRLTMEVESPAYTIWYGDAVRGYIRAPRCCGVVTTSPLCTQAPTVDNIAWRHNFGADFAFVDGHVEWWRKSTTINLTNYYWDLN